MTTQDMANLQAAEITAVAQEVRSYDFQQAGRLSESQMQALTALHEPLVRNLTYSLGTYLNAGFQAKLTGIEEVTFTQLVAQTPASVYTSPIGLQPQLTIGGVQMDVALCFPMLELVLGGPGTTPVPERGLSEIEEYMMQEIVRLICGELEKAWKPLDTSVSPGERINFAQLQKVVPGSERMLLLRFEVRLQEMQGALNVFIPVSTAVAMLRKTSKLGPPITATILPPANHKMQERLLECLCRVELKVSGVKVSFQELLYIEPGKLLNLGIPLSTSAVLCLEGQDWYQASPVRAGTFRAAKLANRLPNRSQNHG